MSKDTGGPAFPFSVEFPKEEGKGTMYSDGMTLRDYFAAKAMQAWLSTYPTHHGPDEVYAEGVAEFAYEVADAMLKARQE
jgi:hypothetical protein